VTAEYVRARHFHGSQRFEEGPDGSVDLVMTTGGRELENLALEYGWTVEVIEPPWLRAKVAEHHRRAAAYYTEEIDEPVLQGELYWATVRRFPQDDAKAHPHLVLQDDLLNESRLPTVTVVGLTSNLKRANEPGNVMLDVQEGGLDKASVIVVSQVSTVLKSSLGARIGQLSPERVSQALNGLRFQQRSFR
jgi:mRNA interferase MazF